MDYINFNNESVINRIGARTGKVLLKKSTEVSRYSHDNRPR
jgi:hypothetical protein